jgi:D-3-phosphoglycerate dehydrogenase
MPLVIWSRRLTPGSDAASLRLQTSGDTPVRVAASAADVAAEADVLSVHLALAPETRGLVNADLLSRLPRGAMVINTARAEVVDYAALEDAAKTRGLRVGLDVFKDEPSAGTGEYRDPLVQLPMVYGTHHVGASTDQAQEAIAAETVRIVRTFQETGKVPNVVNLATRTPATHLLVVRHRDRPGVLAHVFDQLRAASINVQETENVIFEGAEAAVARIHLDRRPSEAMLALITSGNEHILSVQVLDIAVS